MVKVLTVISFFILGIFVIANPVFSHRGGTTDLSFMNLNVFVGLACIIFAIVLIRTSDKYQPIDEKNKEE